MTQLKQTQRLVIYVGSRRLVGLLCENQGENVRVIKWAQIRNAEGFQKGSVAEIEKGVLSLGRLLEQLGIGEEASDLPVYVLLSGPHLKMTRFSSSLHYQGYPKVVTPREIARVIHQTRSVAPLPLEDWILEVVPESFWVNDLTGVYDPIGLEAQRLVVSLEIFTTQYSAFRNLMRAFETLELNIRGYIPKTLVLSEGVLNGSEKEREALLVDFSDEATHLILTREGRIVQTKSLEAGSRFLTNRVAQKWHLGVTDAEALKERFGSLAETLEFGEELIPLIDQDGQKRNHQIKRSEFHQSFLEFGEELFSIIEKEIKELLRSEKIDHPSFVVTGGGAKLDGLLEFLGKRFSVSVRLGSARPLEGATENLLDPAWAGPVGLLRWLDQREKKGTWTPARENWIERTLLQTKEWLAAYF